MEKFNSAKMYSSNATAWKPLFNYLQLSGCLLFGRWETAATARIGNSLRSKIRKTCWYSLAASPSRNTNSKLIRTSCRRPIMFRADKSWLPSFLLSFRDFYCFMLQSITQIRLVTQYALECDDRYSFFSKTRIIFYTLMRKINKKYNSDFIFVFSITCIYVSAIFSIT